MELALKYIRKYFKGYAFGLVLLIAINSLGAYIPQLIRSAINKLEMVNGGHAGVSDAVTKAVILIIVLALVMAIIRVISRRVLFGIGRNVECDLKRDIFNHLITLSSRFFTEKKTGDLISIITNDVQSIRALTGFAMLNVLNTIIAFSIIVPLMLDLNVKLTLYFLAAIPVAFLLVTLISQRLKDYQEAVQKQLGELSHFVEQNLSGIHIIKAYAQEEAELKRFSKHNNKLLDDYVNLIRMRSIVGPSMRMIASIGIILLLYFGGSAVIGGSFSLGDFTAFALYIERLIWPVATLGWLITVFYRAGISSARINNILYTEPTIKDHSASVDKSHFDKEIALKSFTGGRYEELELKIPKGVTAAIIGTIASGKSTLASKLMHLTELEPGEIFIDDLDVKNIKLESLRSLVNLVPQTSFLFSTSIKENISYAVDLPDEEVEQLAKLVGIHDEVLKFPEGYETVVGERGVTLSGGQRQRIAIARALAVNPEILVLDDALSSVDNDTASLILNSIKELRKGQTTIFITHKMSVLKQMDQVYVMDKMKIIEHGSYEELSREESSVFKSIWNEYLKGAV